MEEHIEEPLLHRRIPPKLAVLALDGTILSVEPILREFLAGFPALKFLDPHRLPQPIDDAVREVLAAHSSGAGEPSTVFCPIPELVVRATLLEGPEGACMAVTIERFNVRSDVRQTAAELGLSAREAQIGELLVQGFSAAHIAERLNITRNTVREHVKHIHAKLGVTSRAQLVSRLLNLSGS
jgi:DNA-binding NarL/FixJ family response regulator